MIWAQTQPGPFIINYVPEEGSLIACKFSVIGWRGNNSLRLYIGKHDRVHFLHLIGEELSPWLQVIRVDYLLPDLYAENQSEMTLIYLIDANEYQTTEARNEKGRKCSPS